MTIISILIGVAGVIILVDILILFIIALHENVWTKRKDILYGHLIYKSKMCQDCKPVTRSQCEQCYFGNKKENLCSVCDSYHPEDHPCILPRR